MYWSSGGRNGGEKGLRGLTESVSDFVRDDAAKRPELHRHVGLNVKEGRLQDGAGEDDLVEHGVVVGVDRVRGHVPTTLVGGRLHARNVELQQVAARRQHVGQVAAAERQARVVRPGVVVGVADLGLEAVELEGGVRGEE